MCLQENHRHLRQKTGVIDEQEGDVYYEIFVRAFRDSNGDHIGDFKGIEEQIPYLASWNYGNLADADHGFWKSAWI